MPPAGGCARTDGLTISYEFDAGCNATSRAVCAGPETQSEDDTMTNPFSNRALALNGPATDIAPVIPSDAVDLPDVAIGLYIESAGMISLVTATGHARVIKVDDHFMLPVGVKRVNATGTTAEGIHAMVLV